jgi:hypothetical protein
MPERPASITLRGSSSSDHWHVCGFFNSTDEEYRVMLPFLLEGDIYTPGGVFDGARMLARLEEVLSEAPRLGVALTRLWAPAALVRAGGAAAREFLEYETRLTCLLPRYSDAVVCVYDLERSEAGLAFDVLRTHPAVLVGHRLQENPYFVPPDLFLSVLAERRPRVRRASKGT